MLKHIVIWQLKEAVEDRSYSENAHVLRETLESLVGKIPGLLKIEVGFDENAKDPDVVLYSELESWEALSVYKEHPDHQAVIPLVKTLCTARRVVDYEV
ncbi:hypothetical protein MNBD_NITROSPIRAE01-1263 [hydrothermal vent metagenome]|uniref:Stress-response A/B barrel domain-containing protein n=1 Tax=hydrothermal vent metagenome TaxID=652676 RepID=A0A3B1CFB6_9ZZZZ|nr:Dabb family protein [Candidatus Manganitrophaceae bacterium]